MWQIGGTLLEILVNIQYILMKNDFNETRIR
jgi:hypothetical protein